MLLCLTCLCMPLPYSLNVMNCGELCDKDSKPLLVYAISHHALMAQIHLLSTFFFFLLSIFYDAMRCVITIQLTIHSCTFMCIELPFSYIILSMFYACLYLSKFCFIIYCYSLFLVIILQRNHQCSS